MEHQYQYQYHRSGRLSSSSCTDEQKQDENDMVMLSSRMDENLRFGSPSFLLKFPFRKKYESTDDTERYLNQDSTGIGRKVQLRRKLDPRSVSAEEKPLMDCADNSQLPAEYKLDFDCGNEENLDKPMKDDEDLVLSDSLSHDFSCYSEPILSFKEEDFLTPDILFGRKRLVSTPHLPCLSGEETLTTCGLDFNDADELKRNNKNKVKQKKVPNLMIRRGNCAKNTPSLTFAI